MQLVACLHTDFDMEIQHSQLKLNHLSNTPSTKAEGAVPSTKAVGGGIFSGVFNKDVKVPLQEAELVGTSSSNICSHGIVMNNMDESHFYPDSVGKSKVPITGLKCTKSRGRAVKGEMMCLVMNLCMNSYDSHSYNLATDI
jgi:hypothetical protein